MLLQELSSEMDTLLGEFKFWCGAFPGPIADSLSFVGQSAAPSGKRSKHAVITFLQHGDEWGTLPVMLDLLPWLKSTVSSELSNTKVTVILGNPKAAAIRDRWVDYDLNRCYPHPNAFCTLLTGVTRSNESVAYESKRAKEIASVVATADMVLDLHQTSQPICEPFFVFPFHKASFSLAQRMNSANVLLTRNMGPINGEEHCIDDFAQALNIPTVVVEVGQKGDNPISRKNASDAIFSFVNLALEKESEKKILNELRLLNISHRYKFSNRADKVTAGLINFSPVKRGTPLITGEAIVTAPKDGFVVFMQRPPRDSDGLIIGAIPSVAICFAEDFLAPM